MYQSGFAIGEVVNTLCDRISKLEKSIMEQFGVITELTKRGLRVDVEVQANIVEQERSRAHTHSQRDRTRDRHLKSSVRFKDNHK